MQVSQADQHAGQHQTLAHHPHQHPTAKHPAIVLEVVPGREPHHRERRKEKKIRPKPE